MSQDSDKEPAENEPQPTGEFQTPTGELDANSAREPYVDSATLDGGEQRIGNLNQLESFGDYEIQEEIARGGMGVVFRALQKSLDRPIALKMILAGELASEEDVRRFYAEAEAAAKLDHPNIVPIYEIGSTRGTHYFSMKLIEGADFGVRLASLRSNLRSTVQILEKVCLAVAHAHQRGVLHRDLKPANILLDKDLEPYVTDLGLARHVGSDSQLTKTGAVVGTPSYMSPEQAAGESDLTISSDVYSLGAILYEVLAGQPPFRGKTPMETLMQVISDAPVLPSQSSSTDRSLEMIALKCLEKRPEDRYVSALELAKDLRRWLEGEPLSIRAPSATQLFKNWVRQNFGRAPWILVVGSLGGLTSGLCLWNVTVQRETAGTRDWVYDRLQSVDAPFALMTWTTPDWMMLPLYACFVISILLLGFFTALLVQTKNTSADVAAGLAVGTISAAGAFFFSLGSLSISASIERTDLDMISLLAKSPNETPLQVIDEYPEFADVDRDSQVNILKQKILVDRNADIPRGLLLAVLACFSMFVVAGIAETVVAGSALRREQPLWRAFGEYLLRSFPYVGMNIFVSLHLAILLIFRASGIITDWQTVLTISPIVLGVWAELRRWPLPVRCVTFGLTVLALLSFFAKDFELLPQIARNRRELQQSLQKAERYPENLRVLHSAASAYQSAGLPHFYGGRYSAANQYFESGIDYIETLPEESQSYELRKLLGIAYGNSAVAWFFMGREQTAFETLQQAVHRHPNNASVQEKAIEHFLNWNRTNEARQFLADFQVRTPEDLRVLKQMALTFFQRVPELQDDAFGALSTAAFLEQKLPEHLPQKLTERFTTASQLLQNWILIGPSESNASEAHAPSRLQQLEQIETELLELGQTTTEYWSDQGFVTKQVISIAPRQVDLAGEMPDQGNHTAAYAIGTFTSSQPAEVTLALGSDDGFVLWLNGKLLAKNPGSRVYVPRENLIPAQLNQGTNTVVIRIDQNQGPWEFGLQIDDAQGWPAEVAWSVSER